MLKIEFDHFPDQDESKDYFVTIYLVNDAGYFKKEKNLRTNTLFSINEQICNIGRLGNSNKTIQTPMHIPKIESKSNFNILGALAVEIVEVNKKQVESSIFGCHMLTPNYYEEELHP